MNRSDHLSEESLYMLVDAETVAGLSVQDQNHLDTCTACQTGLAEIQAMLTLTESWRAPTLQLDLTSAVLQAVRTKPSLILPAKFIYSALFLQILTGFIVIAFAAPALLGRWKVNPAFTRSLQDGFQTRVASILNFWDRAESWTSQLFDQVAAFELTSSILPYSTAVLIGLLIASGLLWLMGTGLFLRQGEFSLSASASQG